MRRRAALLVLVLVPVLAAAGCGQDEAGLIADAPSQDLVAAVDRIEAACSDEDVQAAQSAVDEATAQVTELPQRVDEGLRQNLREWLEHIGGRLDRDCEPEEPEETATPEPTPEPTETPIPTETPEPTPEPTETPEPTPTEEPPPPADDEGGVPAPDELPEEVPGEDG